MDCADYCISSYSYFDCAGCDIMYGHLAQWDERIGARSLCEGSPFCFICGQKEKGHYICDPDIAQFKINLVYLEINL